MVLSTAILHVDLAALCANYRLLQERHAKYSIAAVVKANAYGLGVEAVSQTLWQKGCRDFFVATLEEGLVLRMILPHAWIGIFNGLRAGEEKEYQQHNLTPALNNIEQVETFLKNLAPANSQALLHIDTGMTRLGLTESDLQKIGPTLPANLMAMSHLACANEPEHPKNAEQLARFKSALTLLPHAKASLTNSSGLFLASEFHFDKGRPGCALYGINPTNGLNPMQPVARLSAPILQIRTLDRDETIGYGATCYLPKNSRVAIIALGYADGWPRRLSNKGIAYAAGYKVPIIGRISMDMLALDVSAIPESLLTPTTAIEFINNEQTVDDIAAACDTIGYEILTSIGDRVKRAYS